MNRDNNYQFRKENLRKLFKSGTGYELDLENPKTFNEKLQWLKLYYHNPLMTKCADKYLAREYIKDTVGEDYLIPLLGVWDKAEDIDFDSLPKQFVLKVNWGSGMNIVVKDKSKLDIEDAKNKLKKWINPFSNHYYASYEYSYKYIEPKIVCEKYMKDLNTDNLIVYRIYCFDGIPKYIHAITDAHTGMDRCNIYDTKWNKLDLVYIFDNTDYEIPKPEKLNLMLDLASKLSKEFVHIGVDFFSINNQIYCSELTFYTNAGLTPFEPKEWDYKFGECINLPKDKKVEYDFVDRETLLKQSYNLEFMVKDYRDLEINNNLGINNNEIQKLKLNSNWWTLFGISNNDEYLRITLFGIKFSIKMNKEKVDRLAWFIPIRKLRESFKEKFKMTKILTGQDRTGQDRMSSRLLISYS